MGNKFTRRKFITHATVVTAAACAKDSLAVAERLAGETPLASTLLPRVKRGLVDVARNRVAYQSSAVDDDHTAHLATDGSDATYWEPQASGEQWICVDLAQVFPIQQVTILWGDIYARDYQIQVSTDNGSFQNWATVFRTSDGHGQSVHRLASGIRAKHIRLIGTSAVLDRSFAVRELEVWSSSKQALKSNPKQIVSGHDSLIEGWSLQSAQFTRALPQQIASPRYEGSDWIPAVVPGTVLTSYLAAEAIPNPFYGNQQTQVSESFFTNNDFWYRNSFEIAMSAKERRLWLVFEGINWKADVYFNGTRLGAIDGAFIRGRFEVTRLANVGGTNCVAVLVRKVAHPGPVQHKRLGQTYRNGGILGLDSPTFLASIGWNWLPTIRGRNVGVWNHVRFETTGDVLLVDPWVTSEFPKAEKNRANLTFKAELANAADSPQKCVLALAMDSFTFRKEFTLEPHETRPIAVDHAEWPQLSVENPRLWWPNGYGDPALHIMQARIECEGAASDEKSVHFGIRRIDYHSDNGILTLFVNGQRILCRGGNWGMDNGMLICDQQGYDLRVRMHRDMHMNMIRNWVGMVGRDEFYQACDRYGILVWDDFWLANPSDGPDPSDHAMFMSNARDKIRRVRSHPSLALYCGRNEGDPPPDLDASLRSAIAELDGTRYYIPASASGLVTGHGPYYNQDPAWYFAHRGRTFHSEQGIVCIPPVESMRAMMPEEQLWPISDMWAIHDYQNPRSVLNTERIARRYGSPNGIEDYCRKAQLVNLETAKAIFECLQSHQGSGQLLWMSQAAWPALICQLYDYYFEQTAAYFGAKSGCEPLHILWDQDSNLVKAANNTGRVHADLVADASVYDLSGRLRWQKRARVDLPATSATECFPLEVPDGIGEMFFVKLRLHAGEKILSENFYWSPLANGDCTALNTLPQVRLECSAKLAREGLDHRISAKVTNPGESVALAIRAMLREDRTGHPILPAMYLDNYFSLLPGESKATEIRFASALLHGEAPRLLFEGWNVQRETLAF